MAFIARLPFGGPWSTAFPHGELTCPCVGLPRREPMTTKQLRITHKHSYHRDLVWHRRTMEAEEITPSAFRDMAGPRRSRRRDRNNVARRIALRMQSPAVLENFVRPAFMLKAGSIPARSEYKSRSWLGLGSEGEEGPWLDTWKSTAAGTLGLRSVSSATALEEDLSKPIIAQLPSPAASWESIVLVNQPPKATDQASVIPVHQQQLGSASHSALLNFPAIPALRGVTNRWRRALSAQISLGF
ncbi:hypothetical protein BGZ61DRAFT_512757 [Ilyonectria robusta]|uniref:uncharacterized protein n=1 Tax=Ilyonectria robusta TaxID=1079257 RepID=UPI001E8EDFBE|nr:uncharacterized protein BGZ61DRAFT_512757 [Ilyonectria robusta]KAH8738381.1 hypothetical protein BGZ61DRAFT_512757 [Ilyonectria robusta]